MTVDLTCPTTDHTVMCPVVPVLLILIDEVRTLSEEIKEIHRILDGKETKTEKSTAKRSKTTVHRQRVNEKMKTLQMKDPAKIWTWTSEDFAKKIGCSGAAVRQTEAWRTLCKAHEVEKQNHRLRKGYKNKQGDLEAYSD